MLPSCPLTCRPRDRIRGMCQHRRRQPQSLRHLNPLLHSRRLHSRRLHSRRPRNPRPSRRRIKRRHKCRPGSRRRHPWRRHPCLSHKWLPRPCTMRHPSRSPSPPGSLPRRKNRPVPSPRRIVPSPPCPSRSRKLKQNKQLKRRKSKRPPKKSLPRWNRTGKSLDRDEPVIEDEPSLRTFWMMTLSMKISK